MPTLKWFPPEGAPRTFTLFKPVSTIGRALGNDVAGRRAAASPRRTRRSCSTGATSTSRRSTSRARSSSTARRSAARASSTATASRSATPSSQFSMFDEPVPRAAAPSDDRAGARADGEPPGQPDHDRSPAARRPPQALRVQREADDDEDIDELLEAMLDAVIEVTGRREGAHPAPRGRGPSGQAEGGAAAKPVIRASRNVKREAITDTTRRHQRQHRAARARDRAPGHRERRAHRRAVRLERERARAAPLERHVRAARVARGKSPGAMYVGNDRVKGLFERCAARRPRDLRRAGLAHPPERDAPERPPRRQGEARRPS